MSALIFPGGDGREELVRWGVCTALVVFAHCAAVASYVLMPSESPPGAPAAPAVIVDLAPVPVAPPSPVDLAPGPEMVEAQPTPEPQRTEQPKVVEPMPKIDAPAEVTLPPPEPKPTPVEKEVEKKDTEKTSPVKVEQQAPAPRTTAAPRSEQRTAPEARAPSPGSAESRAAIASWRDHVVSRLQQAKRYPGSAQSNHEQGVVTLSFSVDRHGKVTARGIARSSGYSSLDQEVLAMIQRAQPLPPFPPAMPQQVVHLTVPIRFSLQ